MCNCFPAADWSTGPPAHVSHTQKSLTKFHDRRAVLSQYAAAVFLGLLLSIIPECLSSGSVCVCISVSGCMFIC